MQINGKEIQYKFNTFAGEMMAKVKGLSTENVNGEIQVQRSQANIMALLWPGYLGWCYVKQVDPDLTFEEISDWVDTADENTEILNFITAASKAFTESQFYIKLIKRNEQAKAANEKKSPENLSGTISTNLPGENLG